MKKRILSLFLSLVLCLCAFPSCDDEESSQGESSSESTYESQAPEQVTYPYIDSDGLPVFRDSTDIYEYINVQAREELQYSPLDTIAIDSYDALRTFMLQNLNQSSINGIDESFFNENFLLAVYRDNNRKMKEHYCYSELVEHKTLNYHYTLRLEYMSYPDKGYTMEIAPNTFDLVKIPKSLISTQNNINKLVVDIKEYRHTYNLDVTLSSSDIIDYDTTINKPTITKTGIFPELTSVKTVYKAYNVDTNVEHEEQELNAFLSDISSNRVITDYDSFVSILNKYTAKSELEGITSKTLDDHIIVVTALMSPYRHNELYGDIKKVNGYYILDFEYMIYSGSGYTTIVKPITMDFVLIPRSAFSEGEENITIHFRKISHLYGCETEYDFPAF